MKLPTHTRWNAAIRVALTELGVRDAVDDSVAHVCLPDLVDRRRPATLGLLDGPI